MFNDLTEGQRKYERNHAAGFLFIKKLQDKGIRDLILSLGADPGLTNTLIDLLAEYAVQERGNTYAE